MNGARIIKGLVVCLAVLGFCLPQPLLAAAKTDGSPSVADVTLQKSPQGNVLIGRVLDQQGVVRANVPVALYKDGRRVSDATTDGGGFFSFANLRGGVYQVAAGNGVAAYRVWTPGTAPPSAQPGALVIAGQDLVRGQYYPVRHGYGKLKFWLSHPLVIAGIIAAAVAIPVAIHNADRGPESP